MEEGLPAGFPPSLRPGRREVVVVGCGVVGLSTGIRLLEAGFPVRILARAVPPGTTSDRAGAIWLPVLVGLSPRAAGWARATFDAFLPLARDPATGVSLVALSVVTATPGPPSWATPAYHLQSLDRPALPPGAVAGFRCRVPMIEVPRYLPWLRQRFEALGGEVEEAVVAHVAELFYPGRLVVNCAGLGARMIADDPGVYPVRGQVVRVEAPGARRWLADNSDPGRPTYVLPRSDGVILGGTAEEGVWDLEPRPEHTEDILARCRRLEPALADAQLRECWVGLRPGRREVRLEGEVVEGDSALVHNYGHGGAGYTLSWGCADEVVRHARRLAAALER